MSFRSMLNSIRSGLSGPQRAVGYRPHLPEKTDHDELVRDVAAFLNRPQDAVREQWRAYTNFSREQQYATRFGERKTFCLEEAFVTYAILQWIPPPPSVVEIGTQHGKSTRRILDMMKSLGIGAPVSCFDVVNLVKFFEPHEATLVLKDVTDSFQADVLDRLRPGLIYLDAHPYRLLKNIITTYLASRERCVLLIHDSGRGLCNPVMTLDRENPDVTSESGVWERHVLAEIFNVADPLDAALDHLETSTHRMHIFNTTHGLAAIVPKTLDRAPVPGT